MDAELNELRFAGIDKGNGLCGRSRRGEKDQVDLGLLGIVVGIQAELVGDVGLA